MDDLEPRVEIQKVDEVEKDVSCDSNFILGIMDELGNATQTTYHSIGVAEEEIFYLAMDNAGDHGINEYMLEYSEYLAVNHNIVAGLFQIQTRISFQFLLAKDLRRFY